MELMAMNGFDLTKAELDQALANPANQPKLPAAHLERFNAAALASVLQQEIIKAAANGLSHVSLNMNLTDTAALVRALEAATKAGH